MPTGRPTKPLDLTPEEIEKLTTLARRRKTSQALAIRARIVLGCGDGTSNGVVARRLGITAATVGKWREGVRRRRLAALVDQPRPRAPRAHRAAPGRNTQHQRRTAGGSDYEDRGNDAIYRNSLEHAADGRGNRAPPERDRAALACFRTAAAPRRELQILQGVTVHREGAAYCGVRE